MKRTLVSTAAWTLALAAAGAGAWLALRPAPVPCDVEPVVRGSIVVTVDEDGRTRLKDRYVVSAPLPGHIDRVVLRPGDTVRAGVTLLARVWAVDPLLLDERSLAQASARVKAAEALLLQTEAALASAEANLSHVQEEYERLLAAADRFAASRHEAEDELIMLRTATHARDAARFARQVAAFELEQSQAALLYNGPNAEGVGADSASSRASFEVRAPIDGKVLRVLRESEGVVDAGEPLLEVGSLDRIEVELDVLSDQAVKVRPGARVSLERWGGIHALQGVVRLVEPSGFTKVSALGVDEQRVNVVVDFLDGPESRPTLGDGYRVEARIVIWESADAVRAPIGALFRLEQGWGVFVVDGGRARRRSVSIGQRSDQHAEVLDGLREGEVVIVFPSDRVTDGARIVTRQRR